MQTRTLRYFIRESLKTGSINEFGFMLPILMSGAANAPGPCDDIIKYDTDTILAIIIGGSILGIAAVEATAGAAAAVSRTPILAGIGSEISNAITFSNALKTAFWGYTLNSIKTKSFRIMHVNASSSISDTEKRQKTTALLFEIFVDVLILRLSSIGSIPNLRQVSSESLTAVGRIWQAIKNEPAEIARSLGINLGLGLAVTGLEINKETLGEGAAQFDSGRKMLKTLEFLESMEAADRDAQIEVQKFKESLGVVNKPEPAIKDIMFGPFKIGSITPAMMDCAVKVYAERMGSAKPSKNPQPSTRSANV
jgi:hypothetical protein